jgi:hypothetical protein
MVVTGTPGLSKPAASVLILEESSASKSRGPCALTFRPAGHTICPVCAARQMLC